ncbi:MAG: phosphoribosylformylglycinamidine synthase subunit PurL [Methanobacteriota archaeon]
MTDAAKEVVPGLVYEVPVVGADDQALVQLSEATGVGLSESEMRRVQQFFSRIGRNPRDIEFEALGQAWSEHCCYKSSRNVLKKNIFGIAEEKIICREDAGVAEFDKDWAYVVKIESHNHPSAIEPYGGAATGIGGVLRDVACMGAQPVALVDPLFFGMLDAERASLPKGTRHPRYLFGGVVAGIRDYGNRVGIPTVAGQVVFHPGYTTNCLVNVGCIGIVRKDRIAHSFVTGPGDVFLLLGGRTGRDGIHGVTFASADLTEGSAEESLTAVQLGDPITKEPLIHACLEMNEAGLLHGMKDLGGGGLSCVSGEMARDAGCGAEIHLERVPQKAPGMKPWEIWVSESQERMMVAVPEGNVDAVLRIAKKWDVEATRVGTAIPEKQVRVSWKGTLVFDLPTDFIYEGPVYDRPTRLAYVKDEQEEPPMPRSLGKILLDLLGSQNIAIRDWVIRQYDHEVRGRTLLKPLQGVVGHEGPGDATVVKPLDDSWKGLAITADVNPYLTEVEPYWGSVAAVDEVVRNLAAGGARIDPLADCLNFANPELPEEMGKLQQSARGLGDAARALGVPFVSGNVSLYNQGPVGPVPPTPTLLGVGLVKDVRRVATSDAKKKGNTLLLAGAPTGPEMAGSQYYRLLDARSTRLSRAKLDLLPKAAHFVVGAIEKGLVASAHDVSMGGLGVALTEMAIGGDVGVRADVKGIPLRPDLALFSESNTRWVLETAAPSKLAVNAKRVGIPLVKLGRVQGRDVVFTKGTKALARVPIDDATKAWRNGLTRWLA